MCFSYNAWHTFYLYLHGISLLYNETIATEVKTRNKYNTTVFHNYLLYPTGFLRASSLSLSVSFLKIK